MSPFHENGLPGVLSASIIINGKQYDVYGDAVYILWPWLQVFLQFKQMWSSQDNE